LLSEVQPNEWDILENQTTNGRSFGGFIGYNFQWDSLVVGVDAGYNKMSTLATSSAVVGFNRVVATSDGTAHNVLISGSASTRLIDYATLRMRAGYAFGQFMPYAILGGAVGRFDYSSAAVLSDTQTSGGGPPATFNASDSAAKNNAIVGGFVTGLGMDVALTPNVFLRGEWEFVGFAKVNGVNNTINTGRVALGVRF
jgi:opacity protein-like surface antigen